MTVEMTPYTRQTYSHCLMRKPQAMSSGSTVTTSAVGAASPTSLSASSADTSAGSYAADTHTLAWVVHEALVSLVTDDRSSSRKTTSPTLDNEAVATAEDQAHTMVRDNSQKAETATS